MADTIFFDLDGTLTDSAPGIIHSVAYALDCMGNTTMDRNDLYKFIGPPLMDSFTRFCGYTEEQAAEGVLYYRSRFEKDGIFDNRVYPGIPELLQELKAVGKRLVVATSKPEAFALRVTDHFSLSQYFDVIAGSDLAEEHGTKAEVMEQAIRRCGITDRTSVVMVGDRMHDIVGSKACGIRVIGVLYGYGSKEELERAGADQIVTSIPELGKVLLSE